MDIATANDARRAFIDLALDCGVLRFGRFELKSGRVSPYFFNAGAFNTGAALATLGGCYARAIVSADLTTDYVFGPAYKGIPLAAVTASALFNEHGLDLPYGFNRKEAKTHGEGGVLVGAAPAGNVVIVDDVITAGTAVRESVGLIADLGATPAGVVIGLDRCERGQGSQSAVQEAEEQLGLKVVSVITMYDIIDWLDSSGAHSEHLPAMLAYRDEYGV